MYGAGNIGRGFIGQVFFESGYEVVFIDVALEVVDALNRDGEYPVAVVQDNTVYENMVQNVRAVIGTDLEQVALEIATADIMATAVGVNILPRIAEPLAKGIAKRFEINANQPLDIIICENKIGADTYLRELVSSHLPEKQQDFLNTKIGFVEASIGRMVPVQTEEMKHGNALRVCVEAFNELPVDKDAFKGGVPGLVNLVPYSPFSFYIKRKLFIHNLGHATTAYLGYLKNCNFIYEAIADKEIHTTVRAAMMESATALSREYGISITELEAHVENLLIRFANKGLQDTVLRVGGDPLRKLSPEDRFAGAIRTCLKNNVEPANICIGMAAGTLFAAKTDITAIVLQAKISDVGIDGFLSEYSCLPNEIVFEITKQRNGLNNRGEI